jgi:hypothetical protein
MRDHRGFLLGLGLLVFLAACGPIVAGGEEELFRQIKVDVFDQDWPSVLRRCDELLARFPSGTAAPQASFYRARALSRLPGREAEASAAFRQFIARHPGERLLSEEAWSAILSLDCDPRRPASHACAATLQEGLSSGSAFVSTLSAIRAADSREPALQRRALSVLKRALKTQSDPDIVNEILIALLKIDPREVPQAPAPPPGDPKTAAAGVPTLIRMTVFNKQEKRYDLKVNLPVAFARMLIDSLDQEQQSDLRAEARKQGVNLDDIFQAIQKSGAGHFLDVDTAESRVEIWIE